MIIPHREISCFPTLQSYNHTMLCNALNTMVICSTFSKNPVASGESGQEDSGMIFGDMYFLLFYFVLLFSFLVENRTCIDSSFSKLKQ